MQKAVSNGKILIVDDLGTNRALLKGILRTQGFETDECSSGSEALSYCEKHLPAMVLLDVMMPDLDGIQTCWRLRTFFSQEELPIIMVTNKAEGRDLAEGLAAGANDYVTKPIDRTALLARIANQLSVSSFQRQLRAQKISLERSLAIQNAMGNALPEAIAIEADGEMLTYANAIMTQICGGVAPSSRSEMVCRAFEGKLRAWLQERMSSGTSFDIDQEAVFRLPALTVQVLSRAFSASSNESLRLWLIRDVTATRELERKINQRVRLDTVSVFASGIAHNFNNLFSAILGSTELLERLTEGNEKAERCGRVIEQAIASGSALTHRLSALVKRDLRSSVNEQPELVEVVRDLLSVISKEQLGRIEVSTEIPDNLPRVLVGEDNLREIVGNVVTNALEAIEGSGRVNISAQYDQEAGKIRLSVQDNGPGMEPRVHERLFEPFFTTKNVDPSTGIGLQGNGLGMWNVYNLLKMCDGDIEVLSRKGEGTKVIITLPASPDTNHAGK